MRTNASYWLLTCFLALGHLCFAQSKLSFDNVYKVTLRNSGPIVENEAIKGYFFFYQSDKIDRKTNEYTLQIVDENLNKLKDVKFTDSKDIMLLESSFNGNAISFVFFNDDASTLEYRLYGMDGKMSYSYSKELDKKSKKWFKLQLENTLKEESQNQTLYDIPGRGFISVTPVREDKNYTYEVNFYASGKRRTWNFNPIEDGKYTSAQYLGSNDSIAVLEVLSKDKLMSKETESTLIGINLETGRKVFSSRTQEGGKQIYPMNISTLNGNNSEFLLIGPYYNGSDRVMQDKTEGLGVWLMNNQGKVVKSKYISWAKDLSRYMKVDEKGRVNDMGWVYFHKLMQTDDGKIFAIGEGYKKVADGLGIAMNILTQSYTSGMTKLKITDLLMLELTEGFELKSARVYAKNPNDFSLATGSDFASPHTLALAAKAYGAFDYTFTQMGKDHSNFVSGYTDYERSKDYKGLAFNSISYYDGKFTMDKINLSTKASSMRVMPAKVGSIMIIEYFKKDKRIDVRLEKIN